MPAIIIDGLCKAYKLGKKRKANDVNPKAIINKLLNGDLKDGIERKVMALDNINLRVESGEAVGIIGENGAGKTTLLKVLSRVTLPTSGRAMIKGRVVSLLELGAGFQPDLSGRENIILNAAFNGIGKAAAEEKMNSIIEFAELERFIDTPVKHYSSGMYIRLAFSNAIHMEPDVLLADEVLAVGDLAFQNKCMQKLKEINQSGITLLFVSHDMDAIRRLCTRCIRISQGSLIDMGSPVEVVERYISDIEDVSKGGLGKTSLGRYTNSNAGCDSAEITSVKVLNTDGQESYSVQASQPVSILISFRVKKCPVEVFASLDIRVKGQIAFRGIMDSVYTVTSMSDTSFIASIPADILNELVYTVTVSLRVKDVEETIITSHERASFRVYRTSQENAIRTSHGLRMPGLVSPVLNWKIIEGLPKKVQGERGLNG